jgi:hypothetical protein
MSRWPKPTADLNQSKPAPGKNRPGRYSVRTPSRRLNLLIIRYLLALRRLYGHIENMGLIAGHHNQGETHFFLVKTYRKRYVSVTVKILSIRRQIEHKDAP